MLVEEELKVQWPISRRREMFFDCRHKSGQAASDFYLDVKTLAQNFEIDKLGQEALLCHLLRERIIMDSEGEELQDRMVVSLIASSEMYKSSSSRSARVSRSKARDGSQGKQRNKSERGCFRFGGTDNFRAHCKAKVYCKHCKSDRHNAKTCWHGGSKEEKASKAVGKEKKMKRSQSQVKQAAGGKTGESSLEEEEYDSSTESSDKVVKVGNNRIRVTGRSMSVKVSSVAVDTPRIRGTGLASKGARRGKKIKLLPNSGATMTLVHSKVAQRLGLKISRKDLGLYELPDAQGKKLEVWGMCNLYVIPEGCWILRAFSDPILGGRGGPPGLGRHICRVGLLEERLQCVEG